MQAAIYRLNVDLGVFFVGLEDDARVQQEVAELTEELAQVQRWREGM